MILNFRMRLAVCFVVAFLGFPTSSQATAQTGTKMPAFKLQALDSKFYGTEDAEGMITILYFLGYNCAPCVSFGASVEQGVYQEVRNKPGIQMMGLDIWNGSITQLNQFKSITGITFPLLRQAGSGRDYAGISVSELVILDQEGYVRLTVNGEGVSDYPKIFDMIESLQSNTPLIEFPTRSIYYGRTMRVGERKTNDVKIINTGAGTLEITGIETSVPNLTMNPPSFTLAGYETKTVTIDFEPVEAGLYNGTITFVHNNKAVQQLEIPLLDITVEEQLLASISLAQTSLDFGEADLDKTVEKVITVTNAGPGTLTVSDVQSDVAGLVVSETQFSIPANESKDITITFQPQAEGAVSGAIQIMSDDPDHAVMTVSLAGTGVFVPADPRVDFDGSGKIDFTDFVAFVQKFGSTDAAFDLDGSGRVDFVDFLTFTQSFGKSVSQ